MTQEIAMLHDMTRCTACRGCMVACKQWHDLPPDMSTPFEGQYQSHKDLTSRVYTLIEMKERVDHQGKFHWDFFKKNCFHCGDPACAKGCPCKWTLSLSRIASLTSDDEGRWRISCTKLLDIPPASCM